MRVCAQLPPHGLPQPTGRTQAWACPAVPATEAAGGTACPLLGRSTSLRTPPSPLTSCRPRTRARHWKGDAAGACPAGCDLPSHSGPTPASPPAPPPPAIACSAAPRPAPLPLHQSPPRTRCAFSQSRSEERRPPKTLASAPRASASRGGHASAPVSANGQ